MIMRLIVQIVVWFGGMGALLFLSAGTWHWPAAWVFLALMVAMSLVGGSALGRHDPALLNERLRPPVQKGQPAADKLVLSLLLLVLFIGMVFMGFDAVRFAWSSVPVWVQAIGLLSIVLSTWISFRTMRENSFAAPVVKIQKDRDQQVITTGPYSYVRHPMYFGAMFFFLGLPLLLGSWWGLLFALAIILLLCVRIPIEERALRSGLPGYDAYAARVRYRLIPLVW